MASGTLLCQTYPAVRHIAGHMTYLFLHGEEIWHNKNVGAKQNWKKDTKIQKLAVLLEPLELQIVEVRIQDGHLLCQIFYHISTI